MGMHLTVLVCKSHILQGVVHVFELQLTWRDNSYTQLQKVLKECWCVDCMSLEFTQDYFHLPACSSDWRSLGYHQKVAEMSCFRPSEEVVNVNGACRCTTFHVVKPVSMSPSVDTIHKT